MISMPEGLTSRVVEVHGEAGRSWIDALPTLIHDLEHAWGIRVGPAFPECRYNFVAPAILEDGSGAVVKLSVPGRHLDAEAGCLRSYGGHGAPRLLRHDSSQGAVLMERIVPGTNLTDIPDRDAVVAAVEVMQKLHQAPIPEGSLPTVKEWGRGFDRLRQAFDGATGPLPNDLVQEAQQAFKQLADTMGAGVLLHGDLHHENLLDGTERSWVAIDPQGVIGEAAYEVGAFLRNPVPAIMDEPDLAGRQRERVIAFSDLLGVSRWRIAGWGFSQAVLSAIWSIEDHGRGWEGAIQIASSLRDLAFA
jgi:streptomycin 6-kinase